MGTRMNLKMPFMAVIIFTLDFYIGTKVDFLQPNIIYQGYCRHTKLYKWEHWFLKPYQKFKRFLIRHVNVQKKDGGTFA